jgi:hypothetical protein
MIDEVEVSVDVMTDERYKIHDSCFPGSKKESIILENLSPSQNSRHLAALLVAAS